MGFETDVDEFNIEYDGLFESSLWDLKLGNFTKLAIGSMFESSLWDLKLYLKKKWRFLMSLKAPYGI